MRTLLMTMALLWASSAAAQMTAEGVGPADTEEQAVAAGYDRGFFVRASDGPFELRIQARLQARYELALPEEGDDKSAFEIRRVRLTLQGRAFSERLRYKFQTGFGGGEVTLKDFIVDYELVDNWLQLRVGQWKRPFSRQQITSSGRLQWVDRARTDRFFDNGRDIGVALHNGYERSPEFEYAIGLFNGTGDRGLLSGDVVVDPAMDTGEITSGRFSNVPDRFHPLLVLRFGYNHGSIRGYSESDLEGGPFRLALGASILADFDYDGGDNSELKIGFDFNLKHRGFSATGGFFAGWAQDGGSFGDQRLGGFGALFQTGYVIGGQVEPVAHYTLIDERGDNNNVQETGVGFNVFLEGHGLKWQTDVIARISETAGADTTDYRLRTQLQLSF